MPDQRKWHFEFGWHIHPRYLKRPLCGRRFVPEILPDGVAGSRRPEPQTMGKVQGFTPGAGRVRHDRAPPWPSAGRFSAQIASARHSCQPVCCSIGSIHRLWFPQHPLQLNSQRDGNRQ